MPTDTTAELVRIPKTDSKKIFGIYYLNFYQILSVIGVFVLWEIAGRWPISPAFPTFSATMYALFEMIFDGRMIAAFLKRSNHWHSVLASQPCLACFLG